MKRITSWCSTQLSLLSLGGFGWILHRALKVPFAAVLLIVVIVAIITDQDPGRDPNSGS